MPRVVAAMAQRLPLTFEALIVLTLAVPFQALDSILVRRISLPSVPEGDTLRAPASPCAPSDEDLAALQPAEPLLKDALLDGRDFGVKFYLHEYGVFNFSDRVDCYINALGTDYLMTDMDWLAPPNIAEHTTDIWMLRQLRKHPGRVTDPTKADVHIIGAAVGASFHAAKLDGEPCGDLAEHHRRVANLVAGAKENPHFNIGGARNWLVIDTDWNWHRVWPPENPDFVSYNKLLLATADRNISAFGYVAAEDTIVMPYKAHGFLDRPFPLAQSVSRRWSYTFHGNMDRSGAGSSRRILLNITDGLANTSVKDVSFYDKDVQEFAKITDQTARTLQDSTFCFVPAGDTASSRRLFDALAAGCVPIIIHTFGKAAVNLPFTHSIDWTQIAYFAGGFNCLENNVDEAKEWLKNLLESKDLEEVKQKQQLGRRAFVDLLSYRVGDVVTPMLGEVGLALEAGSL